MTNCTGLPAQQWLEPYLQGTLPEADAVTLHLPLYEQTQQFRPAKECDPLLGRSILSYRHTVLGAVCIFLYVKNLDNAETNNTNVLDFFRVAKRYYGQGNYQFWLVFTKEDLFMKKYEKDLFNLKVLHMPSISY